MAAKKEMQVIDFRIVLKNGSKCSVRYFPKYSGGYELDIGNGIRFYHRMDHFEFRGNIFVSDTLYRSHFIQIDHNGELSYRDIAERIANEIAGFEKEENTQQALF